MSLFKDILLEMSLLKEEASINDINDAINGMLMVKMSYDDGEGGSGERIVCPIAYGMSTKSNPVVRAFQKSGPSKSNNKPNWRLFKVSNITSWENIENNKYDPSDLVGANPDGDKQMSIVYTIAKIGSAKDIQISKSKGDVIGLSDKPVTKSDVINVPQKQSIVQKADNEHYTANNAIDDIIGSSKNLSKQDNSIDKKPEVGYNVNKIDAPEAKPVKVSEVPGGDKEVDDNKNDKEEKKPITNEPVKKDDLDTPESVKKSFNDFMDRMDNAEKEED